MIPYDTPPGTRVRLIRADWDSPVEVTLCQPFLGLDGATMMVRLARTGLAECIDDYEVLDETNDIEVAYPLLVAAREENARLLENMAAVLRERDALRSALQQIVDEAPKERVDHREVWGGNDDDFAKMISDQREYDIGAFARAALAKAGA